MDSEALSIGELADAAGLTRRAIRFYVQQKLLPPPLGRGRGNHYDARHLARLRRVIALQQAGHSLNAIRQVLAREPDDPDKRGDVDYAADAGTTVRDEGVDGHERLPRDASERGDAHEAPAVSMNGTSRADGSDASESGSDGIAKPQAAALSARLWTRLTLADGIELSFDATKFNPTVEQLLIVRQMVRQALLERE